MAREKQITLKFQATEKNFEEQLNKVKELFKAHNLMKIEYGNINYTGIDIKVERLMSGGPM
jgi:hypothetical protein